MRSIFEIAAARVLDDEFCDLPQSVRDAIAATVAAAVVAEVDRDGQAHRWAAVDELGNPRCTWCGSMLGPKLSSAHPQYGIWCTCTEPLATDVEVVAES